MHGYVNPLRVGFPIILARIQRIFHPEATLERILWDTGPALSPVTPTWPGGMPPSQETAWKLEGDCPVNVGRITPSPYTGAHADVPLHYRAGGAAVGQVPLGVYLGPCRIIHCAGVTHVEPERVHDTLTDVPPRMLLRMYTQMPQTA